MDYNDKKENLEKPLLEKPLLENKNDLEKNQLYKINIKEWDEELENLLRDWGEKSACLSLLHHNDRKYWRNKSNFFSISSIIITTISSSLSLSSTSSQYYIYIMYSVGAVGLFSSLLQSIKQFYNADEKASDHKLISRQYSNFYRTIKLQLALKKESRSPVNDFVNWAFKEYERLIQESPLINESTIDKFKKKFSQSTFKKPDICSDEFIIEINGRL